MRDFFLGLLVRFAERTLRRIGNHVWIGAWELKIEGVAEAEKYWEEKGRGEDKKEFVIKKVMGYIEGQKNLNFITRKILEMFVSRMVDAILEQLNEEIGKDWASQVEDLRDKLAGKIPFID